MGLIIIRPQQAHEERLEQVLLSACENIGENTGGNIGGNNSTGTVVRSGGELETLLKAGALRQQKILFALTTGDFGINGGCADMIRLIRRYPDALEGSMAGLIVDGQEEWYTKSLAREVIFSANMSGCAFPGRPLAEGTGSLYNFQILAEKEGSSLFEAYCAQASEVVRRVLDFEKKKIRNPRILVVHSCDPAVSNTYAAYTMIRDELAGQAELREISLRSGGVYDCAGCTYEKCMHYSANATCFYGGTITEEVYPALEACDALLLLCPNYNDALDASLTAMINRLTSLFRKAPFFDKQLFAVVVSGYSGGDILCRQLIGALNVNKSFYLPPRFCFTETAGAGGSIRRLPDLPDNTRRFARHILNCLN